MYACFSSTLEGVTGVVEVAMNKVQASRVPTVSAQSSLTLSFQLPSIGRL